jgi:hypothetical protein
MQLDGTRCVVHNGTPYVGVGPQGSPPTRKDPPSTHDYVVFYKP